MDDKVKEIKELIDNAYGCMANEFYTCDKDWDNGEKEQAEIEVFIDDIVKQNLALKEENEKLNYIIDKQDRQLAQEFKNFSSVKSQILSLKEKLKVAVEALKEITKTEWKWDEEGLISENIETASQALTKIGEIE